ncbi:PVC-type heme-binding CxxCH protein [Fimbriiglobus ruber]|uniref:Cytochrome c domain-containing protein n=1 Tax=Fimbriiglobus ruber TaxID=1908690 RepID=A0A225DHV0_9BACT|nr:PVC-type heme-binding CxxCH protein [Fimbriiglobus ruber]OWK40573.1 hypothetical protein FRUB_05492 [Fimbriiglobus ruber]
MLRVGPVIILAMIGSAALAATARAAEPKPTDRPVPAKEAPGRMTLPEGFRVTLFAGEPDVVQPIAMTFDARGRLWVVECLSYPKWTRDGKGTDRVVILEDTNHDGVFDKRTVFLDNGANLSGIELGFGGVWLCSSPNLVFVPDRDGDDKPDGPAEVVLDGWNMTDTKHNVFNSLAWGPDGWLYGLNGIQAKAKVGKPGTPEKDRTAFDCGVWRYHPTKKTFEVYAWGTTNPWGMDWDDYGQMFMTNCVIEHLWHVVPGAHFKRMYGQDPNPNTFGLMGPCCDHIHWAGGPWTESRGNKPEHSDAGGGHAHVGCSVYLGDNFPPEYRNSAFMCNLHGSRLNRDTLHRTEVGYVGKHAKDFLFANDPWFRGLSVKYGPDGGLYVSDWTDTGECHNYDKVDLTNGRIYKVVYGTPKPWAGDLSKLTDAELVQLQLHKNDWFVRTARRILQERAAVKKLDAKTGPALRAILTDSPDVTRRLRAVWALEATGLLEGKQVYEMLKDRDDNLRAWALTLINTNPDILMWTKPIEVAQLEKSPFVIQHLAAAMQRMDDTISERVAYFLLQKSNIPSDPNLNLMIWYGVEKLFTAHQSLAVDLLETGRIPLVRQNTIRLLLAQSGEDGRNNLGTLIRKASQTDAADLQLDILHGVRESLTGRKDVKIPDTWLVALKKFRKSDTATVRLQAEAVAVLFRDESVIRELTQRIADTAITPVLRQQTLDILLANKVPGLAPTLRGLLADPSVRAAVVRGLAAYPDDDTPAALLKAYPTLTAAEKADAVQTLAARPKFALALLDAIEKGIVPKADLTVFTARQIQALNDKTVSTRLASAWGTIRPASETRKAQGAKFKNLLTADYLKSADVAHGRAVFTKNCATCHKMFGEGGDVGPELTGSQRANLDYVLENVLDPSAVVANEYKMTTFSLIDGRVLTGLVKKETPQVVTVRTLNDEVAVPTGDIEKRKQTPLSIMPDGLFDALKEDEIRDLVAYLASPRQVPLAAGGSK